MTVFEKTVITNIKNCRQNVAPIFNLSLRRKLIYSLLFLISLRNNLFNIFENLCFLQC